ncbi:aldo/keto reductase [Phytoactinopolyspora mesophila]|uniref:Aldo/keto reductase n=1 Tax=Phytoactinopolyspora mesophila TaxID=2650750 RepID=A0A7K3M8L1_9ACTN|nr:aldo/keto reductase [Phytoactinopolyspora mesophila]NDL59609.1 aldo/keto reductase [Phytoactinopolyspora mesophila]
MITRRRAGRTAAELTTLSLGGAPIGNLYRAVDDDDAAAAIDEAWRSGIRYFDTAPHYGLGLSERRVGAALRQRPRDQYVVSTKVGRLLEPVPAGSGARDDEGFDVAATHRRIWDFSRDGVLRSVEHSLERLGLDRIDVLFLHDPDDHWQQAIDEACPALTQLRDEGVVTAIGAGMNQSEMLSRFVRHADMDLIMLAGRYTLLEQGALDEFLPLCEQRGVSVVAAAVFNSGLLAKPHPEPGAMYNYGEAPATLLRRAQHIGRICERHGTTLPAAAMRFPLAHPAVATVNVGSRDAEQVRRNVQLFQAPIPSQLWSELQDEGLLRADAPVPGAEDERTPPTPGPAES